MRKENPSPESQDNTHAVLRKLIASSGEERIVLARELTKNEFGPGYEFDMDNRGPEYWSKIEKDIQLAVPFKDKEFRLSGTWKEFFREENGILIFKVNSDWVRRNLLTSWNHGGHGYVHEFTPIDEIWIGDTHPETCVCKGVAPDRHVSERYFESCILHETIERTFMAEGMIYWKAHQLAILAEHEVRFLSDAYTEDYRPLADGCFIAGT